MTSWSGKMEAAPLDSNKIPQINSSFIAEEFENELLLFNEEGEKALYLNDTAQAVLQLCGDDLSVGQIIEFLQQQYPDNQDEIVADVIEVLATLESNGVISF